MLYPCKGPTTYCRDDACEPGMHPASPSMTDIYDALMDNLAALAVEAVHRPVMAVQAYWLVLMAQQDSSVSSLTLGTLLRQSREATTLPMPPWAQALTSQALGRLLRDGIWL